MGGLLEPLERLEINRDSGWRPNPGRSKRPGRAAVDVFNQAHCQAGMNQVALCWSGKPKRWASPDKWSSFEPGNGL